MLRKKIKQGKKDREGLYKVSKKDLSDKET